MITKMVAVVRAVFIYLADAIMTVGLNCSDCKVWGMDVERLTPVDCIP